jgi:hypothetical protein
MIDLVDLWPWSRRRRLQDDGTLRVSDRQLPEVAPAGPPGA